MIGENGNFPDFLGIGAPKTGSTWLWTNLKKHPEIWMPQRKELHYFDRSAEYPSLDFLGGDHFFERLLGRKHSSMTFRRQFARRVYWNLRQPSLSQLRWDARYLFGSYNDQWYSTLFDQGRGKVKGEITPAYMMLNKRDVEHIHELMPKAKIIFVMRNPIDRVWSRIRKRCDYNGLAVESLPVEKMIQWSNSPAQTAKGDYMKTFSTWGTCYPEEQLFIGFYEEIKEDPEGFLLRVFDFLGVEASRKYIVDARKRVKASSSQVAMPEAFRLYLAKHHYELIKYLSNTVGRYAENWLEEVELLLQDSKSPLVEANYAR